MADLAPFSAEDADLIYKELSSLEVALDNNPLAYGPKRLNMKVAQVRRALARCEKLFLDVSQKLQTNKRAHTIAKTDVALGKAHLLANDPDTRANHSISDRDAVATGKLRKEIDLMNTAALLVQDLEATLIVIKAKRVDLRDAEGRLKDQERLCREEISLGSHWGSENPEAQIDLRSGRAYSDVSKLDAMLGSVDGEVHLALASGDWEDPTAAVTEDTLSLKPTISDEATPEEVDDLLAGAAPSKMEAPPEKVLPPDPVPLPVVAAPAPLPLPETPAVQAELPSEPVDLLLTGAPGLEPLISVSHSTVDSFIEGMPMEGMAKAEKPKHVTMEGADLMDFLADFESNEKLVSDSR
jgi:hypothetical protein